MLPHLQHTFEFYRSTSYVEYILCHAQMQKKKKTDGVNIVHSGLFVESTPSSYNRTVGRSKPQPLSIERKKIMLLLCTFLGRPPQFLWLCSLSIPPFGDKQLLICYHAMVSSIRPADIRNYICNPGLKSFVCVC